MFSDNMRNLTDKLTKKFGDSVTLIDNTSSVYNPRTGKNVITAVKHDVKAVVSSYDSSDIVSGVIDIDDIKIMVFADTFTITKEWTIEYQSRIYGIMNVSRLSTQDKSVYYELQARKS